MMPSVALVMSRVVRRSNNLRVMIDYSGAMVSSLMRLLTMSIDSLFTLLNINCVNNLLASLLGDLAGVLLGVLVALLLLLVLTVRTARVSVVSWVS